MDYDVIIAGGSFAGLAAAVQVRGKRVLLVEPHSIGEVQTSACGTLQAVLEATGTTHSLLQVHDRILMHLGQRTFDYPSPYAFCTFDYRVFCNRLLEQSNPEVLQASVLGHEGHRVFTTRGVLEAEILIDATGWRAALATNRQQQVRPNSGRSFGLETTIPVSMSGLHFYYDPSQLRPFTVGWLFPIGAQARAGLGSYLGQTQLSQTLTNFTKDEFGLSARSRHGGYFPHRRRPAYTAHVFRTGDAAGQCIPLTGEGIRPALYFGATAGQLARHVLDDGIGLQFALRQYRAFVEQHARVYRYLLAAQKVLPGLPMAWIEGIAVYIRQPHILDPFLQWYWRIFDPNTLALVWGGKLASTKASSRVHVPSAFNGSQSKVS